MVMPSLYTFLAATDGGRSVQGTVFLAFNVPDWEVFCSGAHHEHSFCRTQKGTWSAVGEKQSADSNHR